MAYDKYASECAANGEEVDQVKQFNSFKGYVHANKLSNEVLAW